MIDSSVLSGVVGVISQGVLIAGPDRKMAFCNDAFLDMAGYDDESEVLGTTCRFLQGPDTDPDTIRAISQALSQEREFSGEILNYRKSGETWWNELTITPLFADDGTLTHFIGITRDITKRKRAEQRVSDLEADYRAILDNVPAGIVVHSIDNSITYANPVACQLLRLDEASLLGRHNEPEIWHLIDAEGNRIAHDDYPANRVIRTGESERNVVVGGPFGDDGETVWLLVNAFPLKNERGEVREVLASFTEIGDLLEAKAEAELHRQRFDLVGRATQDVVFDWNLETGEFWANDAYGKVFGRPPPATLAWGAGGDLNVLDEDRAKMHDTMVGAIEGGKDRYRLEYRFQKRDGSVGTALVRAYILRAEDGTALRVIGSTTDISQRLETLAALAKSEERFRVIAGTVSDVLWDHDFDTGRWWVSDDWPDKLGIEVKPSELNSRGWFNRVHPEDRERLDQSFGALLKSDASDWEIEYRLVGEDGETIDMLVCGGVFRHPDGRVSRMVGNARNVTAEKKRNEGYTRARALEAVGQLTGGIAHDFNNQLLIIQGNAESLEETGLDEEQQELVDLISRASRGAGLLTQRLLSFARQSDLGARRVALDELLSGTLGLLRSGLPESIVLDLELGRGLWDARVDPNALEQAVVNLAVNARDAMPSGGRITISCENETIPADSGPFLSELAPGDYVRIAITDNGLGMSAEVQAKVFEPFFTTKDIGKGTGLGLSTVYGFAKQSGGHVSLYSEEGKGTSVNLFLPRHQSRRREPAEQGGRGSTANGRGERILVVEDEPLVRTHVQRLLKRMGYEVVAAADGREALEVIEREDAFDLLLTDVIMPGGYNGQELAEEVARRDVDIAILFTSGYPAYAFESLGLEEQQGLKLLRKPYRRSDLQEAIEAALATRTESRA